MDQAVHNLFNYFKEKCSNDFRKIPFFKGSTPLSHALKLYTETTIMRDYIMDKDPWTRQYVSKTTPHFFKYIIGIESLVENNFDLESDNGMCRPDCNVGEQYIEFVEKYLESKEIPFKKHSTMVQENNVQMTDLKPFLFCNDLSFMIVNLDECEFDCIDKEEYLRYLLITQNIVTLLNGKRVCMSYFISGNSISVFSGGMVNHCQFFNFHRTFNLEKVQDLLDLALEFFIYVNVKELNSGKIFFCKTTYELKKLSERSFYNKCKLIQTRLKSKQNGGIHKQNEMIDKLRKNLKKLTIK